MSDTTGSTAIHEYYQHKSPEDVAEFMLDEGKRVGRKYATEAAVWAASESVEVVGLLRLIVRELRSKEVVVSASDRLEAHGQWYQNWYEHNARLVASWQRQKKRIQSTITDDETVFAHLGEPSLQWFAERYVRDRTVGESAHRVNFWKRVGVVEDEVSLMKKIKCIDDLQLISGIGKKTVAKLKALQLSTKE